jgi:hypothetical protein
MQFSWDDGVGGVGYADDIVGIHGDQIGFFVKFGAQPRTWVEFTIPELRQMLAEAQELAEKEAIDNGDFGPIGDDCVGCNHAPLANEQELADDFEKRTSEGEPPSQIEQLLMLAELSVNDPERAKTYLDIAFARRELL